MRGTELGEQDSGTITYTLKEVLEGIRQDLREIRHGLSAKAEAANLDRLQVKVESLEKLGPPLMQDMSKDVHDLEKRLRALETGAIGKETVEARLKGCEEGITAIKLTIAKWGGAIIGLSVMLQILGPWVLKHLP